MGTTTVTVTGNVTAEQITAALAQAGLEICDVDAQPAGPDQPLNAFYGALTGRERSGQRRRRAGR